LAKDFESLSQSELEILATEAGVDNRGDKDALVARLKETDTDTEADSGDLDSLTKAELQERADGLGVEYTSSDTKADLVAAIEAEEGEQ
jgi:hypothetical protein